MGGGGEILTFSTSPSLLSLPTPFRPITHLACLLAYRAADDTCLTNKRRISREQSVIANVGALGFAAGCSVVASAVAEISPHVSTRWKETGRERWADVELDLSAGPMRQLLKKWLCTATIHLAHRTAWAAAGDAR